jgi:hypothetical protein
MAPCQSLHARGVIQSQLQQWFMGDPADVKCSAPCLTQVRIRVITAHEASLSSTVIWLSEAMDDACWEQASAIGKGSQSGESTIGTCMIDRA